MTPKLSVSKLIIYPCIVAGAANLVVLLRHSITLRTKCLVWFCFGLFSTVYRGSHNLFCDFVVHGLLLVLISHIIDFQMGILVIFSNGILVRCPTGQNSYWNSKFSYFANCNFANFNIHSFLNF